jgi:hypothetical protein
MITNTVLYVYITSALKGVKTIINSNKEYLGGMRRLSAVISDEAKEILIEYQKEKGIRTQDEAIDQMIKDFKKK